MAAESEPLMARLPAAYNPGWMIGHLFRAVPKGYVETLETGENRIQDKNLALFYDKLCVIIRGPIFTRERFKTILLMNFGYYDSLIDRIAYAAETNLGFGGTEF
jgi:arabinofuranosyltransferase